MKGLKVYPTLKEYRKYIYSEIVSNKEFHKHPFYRGLIDFVIDHRSPIFFSQSHDYEYAHFTQYFNYVLCRDYDNSYQKDLYFLHDFIHMVFNNPLKPKGFSSKYFHDVVVSNERVAANDTEIITYYRLPHLRPKTLDKPILYDFLRTEFKNCPDVTSLFTLRNKLIETTFIPSYLDNPEGRSVVAFLKRFKDNNKTWSKLWRNFFPVNAVAAINNPMTLSLTSYELFLSNYKPINSQILYENNVLANIQLGLKMLGHKNTPKSFRECFDYIHLFDGKILMDEAAQKYHQLYSDSKNKALKIETSLKVSTPTQKYLASYR